MAYNPSDLDAYPEIMNKEQMYVAGGISKRTALYLLWSGLVPSQSTGRQTRCYRIKKSDIIHYLMMREVHPEIYRTPDGWYSYGQKTSDRPIDVSLILSIPDDIERRFYEIELSSYEDVIPAKTVCEITGYSHTAVTNWINKGWLSAFCSFRKHLVPKCHLIDFMCSYKFISILRPCEKHIDMADRLICFYRNLI